MLQASDGSKPDERPSMKTLAEPARPVTPDAEIPYAAGRAAWRDFARRVEAGRHQRRPATVWLHISLDELDGLPRRRAAILEAVRAGVELPPDVTASERKAVAL
jgi:hypothetical protein